MIASNLPRSKSIQPCVNPHALNAHPKSMVCPFYDHFDVEGLLEIPDEAISSEEKTKHFKIIINVYRLSLGRIYHFLFGRLKLIRCGFL
jgi:hypothetical protein